MSGKYITILFSCIFALTIFVGDTTSMACTEEKFEAEPAPIVMLGAHTELKLKNKPRQEKINKTGVEKSEQILVNIDIPTHTYSKPYEDGSLIIDETSLAYKWISNCEVDYRGHYMYGGKYYAVAMGTYFDDVGSKYKVSLDTGKEIYVIKCDTKQDQHTIDRMIDHTGGMIEFIIDTEVASSYYGIGTNGYIMNGSFNNHDDFNGKIVKIEQIF